jgi:hypothetical protein
VPGEFGADSAALGAVEADGPFSVVFDTAAVWLYRAVLLNGLNQGTYGKPIQPDSVILPGGVGWSLQLRGTSLAAAKIHETA